MDSQNAKQTIEARKRVLSQQVAANGGNPIMQFASPAGPAGFAELEAVLAAVETLEKRVAELEKTKGTA